MKKLILLFLIVTAAPGVLLAAPGDTFTIITNVISGTDTEAPTTPTLLSADPIAATQINVTWSAVSDNVSVGGYVLFRDSIAIATTTLTNFSDTGLVPLTLYSYNVYAFDTGGNISTTSNSISTTTLAIPVIPIATSTPAGSVTGTMVFKLLSLDIFPTENSATFKWETNLFSRYALRWGRGDSYDEGYIINDTFNKNHQTEISGLEPGAVYIFELVGYAPTGREVQLKTGQFKTISRDSYTPQNVFGLYAEVFDKDVSLNWTMPTGFGEAKVRVVRSYLGYPNDPYDGALIFEGQAGSFLDKNGLTLYNTQYYTVFVIAADGSVSSGAIVKASQTNGEFESGNGNDGTIPLDTNSTSTDNVLPPEQPVIELPNFDFSTDKIEVSQNDKRFNFLDVDIALFSSDSFVISIPYEALPKHLKSIIVTIFDPLNTKRSYSFLLRINKDRTAYEATIAPVKSVGLSRIQVEIFDFEREIIGRYSKSVSFVGGEVLVGEVIFPDKIVKILEPFTSAFWLIFLIVLLIFFLLYRRSKKS
jgi:hypothetical protein